MIKYLSYLLKNIKSDKNNKIKIFILALSIRLVLGYIFFGSIDLINDIVLARQSLNGFLIHLPYFPVIPVFIWFGGVINSFMILPLAFCFKIVPIVFDSLIPLLIFDIVSKKYNPKLGTKSAVLYAISPIAIIINSFHVQWDSIFLFFLILAFYIRDFHKESFYKYFIFGSIFTISFMIKPVSLFALPVFINPLLFQKKNLRQNMMNFLFSVLGSALFFIIFMFIFKLAGYSIRGIVRGIFDYSNGGVQIFGLPFAYPFNHLIFLKSRLWLICIMLLSSFFYHIKRIDVFEYMLFALAISLGLTGLCDQYLVWVIPFLLLSNLLILDFIYNLISSVFLIFYYISPLAPFVPWENMNTYVTLKNFSWLMPGKNYMHSDILLLVKTLGNYFVPMISLIIAFSIIVSTFRKLKLSTSINMQVKNIEDYKFNKNFYLILLLFLVLVLGLTYVFTDKNTLFNNFVNFYQTKINNYNMIPSNIHSLSISVIGNYKQTSSPLNIINVLLSLVFLRSIFSFNTLYHVFNRKKRLNDRSKK